VALAGCDAAAGQAARAAASAVETRPRAPATHPLVSDQPDFLGSPICPTDTPVRVGMLLPFSNGSAATRALAQSMLKAAELALFDAKNQTSC
jgi:hypothetical protein